MQYAAQGKRRRAQAPDRSDPPRIGELERKPGQDKHPETYQQRPMLQTFTKRHAEVEPVAMELAREDAATVHQLASGFPQEIKDVMDNHPAHDHDDEDDVSCGHQIQYPVLPGCSYHVHRPFGEILVRSRMAGSARPHQVCPGNARRGITRRLDVMHTVAARTVRDFDRSRSSREAVVAIGETLEAVGGQTVFLRQANGRMAR
jgi:hypothetical protein